MSDQAIADRVDAAIKAYFRGTGLRPNALYVGHDEYVQARLECCLFGGIQLQPPTDPTLPARESFAGLSLHYVNEPSHFAVVYSPQEPFR